MKFPLTKDDIADEIFIECAGDNSAEPEYEGWNEIELIEKLNLDAKKYEEDFAYHKEYYNTDINSLIGASISYRWYSETEAIGELRIRYTEESSSWEIHEFSLNSIPMKQYRSVELHDLEAVLMRGIELYNQVYDAEKDTSLNK